MKWSMRSMGGGVVLSIGLLVGCAAGGRLGYRHDFRTASMTGVYGGPYASVVVRSQLGSRLTHDPYDGPGRCVGDGCYGGLTASFPTVEAGYLFGRGNSTAFAAPMVNAFHYVRASDQPVYRLGIAVGVEFGGAGLHAVAGLCGGLYAPLNADLCARLSSAGWLGADVGLGLTFPPGEYFHNALFPGAGDSAVSY